MAWGTDRRLVKIIYQHVLHNFEYRITNIEQGMSKESAPAAQFFLELIYGAKRRLPSIFGVPCSSFDIPAEGGSFFKRSLEKSVGLRATDGFMIVFGYPLTND
jgi:hypothetical protein